MLNDHENSNIIKLLDRATVAYATGCPFMSDDTFDVLSSKYKYYELFGDTISIENKAKHDHRMHSLQKVYDEEKAPITGDVVETLKLDGAAISLKYEEGTLVKAVTRGDGQIGEDITEKAYLLVPTKIDLNISVQIEGEVVCPKSVENARNFVSGALHLKDYEEFKSRVPNLHFIAYNIKPFINTSYLHDMTLLATLGFSTVILSNLEDKYRNDGKVYRLNNNELYKSMGYTAKHPRGAYARKQRSDVEIVETTLLNCRWQVGRTGKVTPVAEFESVVIDDANIVQATLHNAGFIEDMDLSIGDTILVTRAGGIIPRVLGKL